MSLFFDSRINLQDELPAVSAWSHSMYQPILTIGTASGKVLMFTEDGEPYSNVSIQRQALPTQLVWHPYLPLLIICWDDGVISYWNENDDNSVKEEKSVHGCRIRALIISPDGTRMVTGDEHGVVGVWSTSRGLNPICQYHKEGSITNIAFCALATEAGEIPTQDQMNRFFFFAGSSGSVHLADDLKRCSEVCKVGGQVKSLLYYKEDNSIVIITSSLLLVQFRVSPNEKLVPTRKVKLTVAGSPENIYTIWGGPGLLVTVSGDNMVRLWNLEKDANYFLTLADTDITGKMLSDKINCIAFHEKKRILAGGTKEGRVIMWKCKSLMTSTSPANREGWEAQLPVTLSADPIKQISWADGEGLLSASTEKTLSILSEADLRKVIKDDIIALQASNHQVEVRRLNRLDASMQIYTNIKIKGMDASTSHCVVWNGKTVESYTMPDTGNGEMVGTFNKKCFIAAVHRDSIIIYTEGQIEICNMQGTVKQTVLMPESEGEVNCINVMGDNMLITTESHIKLFDLSRREYKQRGMPRKFEDKQGQSLGIIKGGSINANGTKVALLVDQAPKSSIIFPDSTIYVYDSDIDNFMHHDFGYTQIPVDSCWDTQDPRLLFVETEGISGVGEEEAQENKAEEQFNQAVTLFVTSEYGITRQDSIKIQGDICGTIGISVPYWFFIGKDVGKDNLSGIGKIIKKSLRDFTGLENCDENVKKAILNFSFYMTSGNMDEAYKAVKTIQNVNVWENMCTMSVKTKRLDVAEVCLSNMRFARGAKAVREAKTEPEIEARLAMVAVELNMLEEAKQLYIECGRYDLLNQMQQACGNWDGALETAETHDRINLRTTYYKLARHYESIQDFSTAREYYERADVHREEVPRMLYSNMRVQDLERYVNDKKDPKLYKWWAQLLESKQDPNGALNFYKLAGDLGSCVRVHLTKGSVEEAIKICKENDTKLGCLFLAKYMEEQGDIREAIQLYNKADRFHHAVRLARDNKLDGDLMSLSLRSENFKIMLQTAKYFEEKHLFDRAIKLYHKGKNVKKALDLCFREHNYEYLRTLVDDLGEEEDPTTLLRAADYFMQENMHEKAVHLLVSAKQYSKALEICLAHNVKLDDNVVEKLIPDDGIMDQQKKDLIRSIAKLCKRQGSFQMACKLFTKLGEKLKAFKCLLRLGDIEKIKSYANTAKNAQIYILAANFLQNTDWHNADVMKSIIFFYTKAKAWDSLANFFDACASVEIDEYRDYEKALIAENEALKFQAKSANPQKDILFQQFQRRKAIMEQFVNAKRLVQSSPEEMVKMCLQLLEVQGVDQAIRIGDVYSLLVEYYYAQQNFAQALQLINKMKQRRIILNPYLDQEMVERIYHQMGIRVENEDSEYIE
ncbi:unnamed protein product [Blepharisma stoltei]|uniref:Intraflagellar transport protein 140 homolog n=1 Tax=Blepharisma stoltei TaxID=1481888 RepID=A0AAU9KKP3_9CILI|nr:unnamed protein product [Blepharisma stoltei]